MHTIWCKQNINTVNLVFKNICVCVCVHVLRHRTRELCQPGDFGVLESQTVFISSLIFLYPPKFLQTTPFFHHRNLHKMCSARALFGLRKMSTKIKLIFSMCAHSGLGTVLCARDTRQSQIWFPSPWAQSPVEKTNLEKHKQVLHRMINKRAAESQGKITLFTGIRTKGGEEQKHPKERHLWAGSEGLFQWALTREEEFIRRARSR